MGTKDVMPQSIVDAHMYEAIYASMENSLDDAMVREVKLAKGEVIRKKEARSREGRRGRRHAAAGGGLPRRRARVFGQSAVQRRARFDSMHVVR